MGRIAKWRTFSEEEVRKIVAESYSIREVARKMGYSPDGGGTAQSLKNMIEEYQLNTSHFTGQVWNKGKFDYSRLKDGTVIKNGEAVKGLSYLRGWKCEQCLNETWLGQKIPLEVHHKDGNNQNNEMDNLIMLCPNCHALTDNWRGRNINKEKDYIPDEQFVDALKKSPNIRQALLSLGLSAKGGNYTRANELIIKYQINHLIKA